MASRVLWEMLCDCDWLFFYASQSVIVQLFHLEFEKKHIMHELCNTWVFLACHHVLFATRSSIQAVTHAVVVSAHIQMSYSLVKSVRLFL